MGSGRWDDNDWSRYTSTRSYDTKKVEEIYESRSLDKELDPKGVIRESRDGEDNPISTAIIVGLDVTGSMGCVLDAMARKGLNTLATEIYNRKPVSDPHLMCMGIGDVEAGDKAPLQCTQFEADIRIAKQLEKIYLEEGGGGNKYESYALSWVFAGMCTSIDCFEKRNKKGYLFTIGDEQPTPYLRKQDLKKVLGIDFQSDLKLEELLTIAQRQYEVFHLIVEEGYNYRYHKDSVSKPWHDLLGQRAIHLSDHTKMGEVIVSTLQFLEGTSTHTEIIDSWDGNTSLVVKKAIQDLTKTQECNTIVTL